MVTIDPNDDNIILGIPEDIDPATLPQEGPIKKVRTPPYLPPKFPASVLLTAPTAD